MVTFLDIDQGLLLCSLRVCCMSWLAQCCPCQVLSVCGCILHVLSGWFSASAGAFSGLLDPSGFAGCAGNACLTMCCHAHALAMSCQRCIIFPGHVLSVLHHMLWPCLANVASWSCLTSQHFCPLQAHVFFSGFSIQLLQDRSRASGSSSWIEPCVEQGLLLCIASAILSVWLCCVTGWPCPVSIASHAVAMSYQCCTTFPGHVLSMLHQVLWPCFVNVAALSCLTSRHFCPLQAHVIVAGALVGWIEPCVEQGSLLCIASAILSVWLCCVTAWPCPVSIASHVVAMSC